MQREILFRGKPKNKADYKLLSEAFKENCKDRFVYGSLIVSKGKYFICVSAMCNINLIVNNGLNTVIEVVPETVGQYTGLTDKNGNKIFEGDIISFFDDENYINYEIKWDVIGWIIVDNKDEIDTLDEFVCERSTVIGNVRDNPELLEVSE